MHETTGDLYFHWADYLVLALSLLLTLGIGVFFFVHDKIKYKNMSNEEFLMGGRNINPFSMGLSFLASFLNAVFLIGVPAEIYYNGAIYCLIGVSWVIVVIIAAYVFVPMFRKMQVTSAYEYLETRFDSVAARVAGSLVFTFAMVLFLAVVLYAPSLAFAQVTGISIHVIQIVCGLICTLYVFLGGLKAVVWTDTIQMIIAVIGTVVIAAVATDKVGGASEVWRIAKEDNRLNFDVFSADPRIRHTVWTQTVLNIFTWLPNYVGNQMSVQRYMAMKTTRDVQIALWTGLIGVVILLVMVTICGLAMYAYFRQCDPFINLNHRKVEKTDQLFPLLLMELLGEYPGIPGLYTAAVFAAALSSVSSAVNSLAAVVLEDFVKPIYTAKTKKALEEKYAIWTSRILTLIFGLMTIGLSYIAPLLGDVIIQIPNTIWGVVGAPLCGMFILAMFFPCANAIGTITGLLVSLTFAFWWAIGAIVHGTATAPLRPLGTDCDAATNTSAVTSATSVTTIDTVTTAASTAGIDAGTSSDVLLQDFYDVSYTYYGLVNTLMCVLVGLIVSVIVNKIQKKDQMAVSAKSSGLVYNWGDSCWCNPCCCKTAQDKSRSSSKLSINKVDHMDNNDTKPITNGISNPALENNEENM